MRRTRIVSSQLQCKISFAGRIQLRRPAGIKVPPAILQLSLAHIISQLFNADRIRLAKNKKVVNVVRFERAIGFQLAQPVAFLGLKRKQVLRAAVDGIGEFLRPILLPHRSRRSCGGRILFTHSDE